MTSMVKADLVTLPIDEDADIGAFVLNETTLAGRIDAGPMTYYSLANLEQAPLSSFGSRVATRNSLFQRSLQVLILSMKLLLSRFRGHCNRQGKGGSPTLRSSSLFRS